MRYDSVNSTVASRKPRGGNTKKAKLSRFYQDASSVFKHGKGAIGSGGGLSITGFDRRR